MGEKERRGREAGIIPREITIVEKSNFPKYSPNIHEIL